MKLSVITILATLGTASAFTPSPSASRTTVAMNAESSRKAFLGAAAAAAALFVGVPDVANAGSMDQVNVRDPTERWETGAPTPAAKAARVARYTNARTQLNSNFAPIKRLTLERKSPVTRLDINAPNFEAYKKTYPGLYKKVE